MKEVLVTYYEAYDGKRFTTEDDCHAYESKLRKYREFFETLKEIKNMCESAEGCGNCPFMYEDVCGLTFADIERGTSDVPYNWNFDRWQGFN
jgi:hypothetical protein